MLTRRAVAATDVPTLSATSKVKPPTIRRRQAFHTSVATWFRSLINSRVIFLHFDFSFRHCLPSRIASFPLRARRPKFHYLLLGQKWGEESIGRWYRPTPSQSTHPQIEQGIRNSWDFW